MNEVELDHAGARKNQVYQGALTKVSELTRIRLFKSIVNGIGCPAAIILAILFFSYVLTMPIHYCDRIKTKSQVSHLQAGLKAVSVLTCSSRN